MSTLNGPRWNPGLSSPSLVVSYAGERNERVVASPQFDGRVFRNPPSPPTVEGGVYTGKSLHQQGGARSAVRLINEYMFGDQQREPKVELPVLRPHDAWLSNVQTGLRATWLGHSTVLLEIDGVRVLTDPVFGLRASPVAFAGPKRFHPVPAKLGELPRIDAVLLSHDHYDHLCAYTMRKVASGVLGDVPVITSLGVGARLEALGMPPERIVELDWHEHASVRGLRFTATPSQHFSGRGAFDRNRTLWSSWVLQTDHHSVFFSGDTGLAGHFEETGRRYGPFDLVMLEVGAWHPAWGDVHLGPINALHVFRLLGGGTLMPVHWGTFNLALHAWDEPAEKLVAIAQEQHLRVLTPRLGQVFEPSLVDSLPAWWREVARL